MLQKPFAVCLVTLMCKSRLLLNIILTMAAAWRLPAGPLVIPAVMYWLAGLMNVIPTDGLFSPVRSIKKDPDISVSTLTNREKTQIADVLRDSYPLTELLRVLVLAWSSFFYHRTALRSGDKYATVRIAMTEIFNGNYRC